MRLRARYGPRRTSVRSAEAGRGGGGAEAGAGGDGARRGVGGIDIGHQLGGGAGGEEPRALCD